MQVMNGDASLLHNIRKRIGSAVWLFGLLVSMTPDVTPNAWTGLALVDNGNPLPDALMAHVLDVSPSTVANWRKRLRAAGLIDWLPASNEDQRRAFCITAWSNSGDISKAALAQALINTPVLSARYLN